MRWELPSPEHRDFAGTLKEFCRNGIETSADLGEAALVRFLFTDEVSNDLVGRGTEVDA